jgi:hypothetical protein
MADLGRRWYDGQGSASAWVARNYPYEENLIFAKACELAPDFFCEPISIDIKMRIVPGPYAFRTALSLIIPKPREGGESTRSIDHLLHVAREIFSPSVIESLDSRLRGFDAKTGIAGLADVSAQQLPIESWIENMISVIGNYCEAEAERQVG